MFRAETIQILAVTGSTGNVVSSQQQANCPRCIGKGFKGTDKLTGKPS